MSNYAMIYAAGHSRIVGPGPLKGVLATTDYEEGMAVAEADIVEDIMKSRSDCLASTCFLLGETGP